MKVGTLLLLMFFVVAPVWGDTTNKTLERISAGFGIPSGLLLTLCERESGPRDDKRQVLRPKAIHDGGKGSGACGMKLTTAALVLGRGVTRKELQNVAFGAVISARYLTEKRWCGRWSSWVARVLCYRVGPTHRVLARVDKTPWWKLPRWWGTRKIFERWEHLHGDLQKSR